ncbi:hypothetical protein JCM5353_003490 [Sporobolomyces roseus]
MSQYPPPQGRNPPPPPPPLRRAPPPPPPAPATTTASNYSDPTQVVTRRSGDVMEPMRRPGYGRQGKPLGMVQFNTFQVQLPRDDQCWWKYEVIIETAARVRPDGTPVPAKPLPKSLLWSVWQQIESVHSGSLGGLQPAYDGRSAVYTNRQLPSSPLVIQGITIPDGKKGTFTATFQHPISIPLDSLRSYISGQGGAVHVGDVGDALQALNVLFRHSPSILFPSTRTSFFPMGTAGMSVKLPQGLQLWRGFFQSVRPCQRGLQLNLDTTSGAYVQTGNLVDLLRNFANVRHPSELNISNARLQGATLISFNRLLRKVRVVVDRGSGTPIDKAKVLKLTIKGGLKLVSARSHHFDVNGTQMSVETFFRNTYGTQLNFPDLPLLEVSRDVLIPIELVSVQVDNKWTYRLSPEQQAIASTFQILKPSERLEAILKMRRNVLETQTRLLSHLDRFGVHVSRDPSQAPARQLLPPTIEYQAEKPSERRPGPPRFVSVVPNPNEGAWKQQKRGPNVVEKLITPSRPLNSAVVVVANQSMLQGARRFFDAFFRNAEALGFCTSSRIASVPQELFFVQNSSLSVATVIRNARDHAETSFGSSPQVIFWLYDRENSGDYDQAKYETVRRGIASQSFVYKKIEQKTNDFSFHLNCALKLNAKLAGFNFRLLKQSTGSFMQDATPLIFGADLAHQADKPSIAVVTASMHNQGILFEEEIKIQPLIEPFSPLGATHAKKSEIIVGLEDMVFYLLTRRALCSLACPPEAIVFFRDGVSEAEVSAVLNREVSAVRQAFDRFKRVYLDSTSQEYRDLLDSIARKFGQDQVRRDQTMQAFQSAAQALKPKITFIVTIKRHHLRAFVTGGGNRTNNVLPGTIVDSDVVDARAFDFYLASHKGIIGTTRPTRYLVLVDDNRLSADQIQEFVNHSSHTYQRCLRAVSLPAAVYYADLIGRRVRGWLLAENNYDATTHRSDESTPQSRLEDFQACDLTLQETVIGRNMFRAQGGPPAMWWL